ncbi:MAG: TM2 domain-containing protein [Pseudomonadota bacterium]|nr:TM2 domain-containing protein [Pseudomonadota bacterium]
MTARAFPVRSKTIATWLACAGGSLGLHRFYLYGGRDRWAWLHLVPTLIGAYGFWRLRELGTDDRLGTELVPLLGVMLAVTMLVAIFYGLMPDARWNARFGDASARPSGGMTILGVCLALAFGATAAMATLAFVVERYFEWHIPG